MDQSCCAARGGLNQPKPRQGSLVVTMALLCLGLSACTTYRPLPLEETPHIAPSLGALQAEANGKKIDVTQPLTISDLAYIAIENNLDLKAQRADHDVSEAQLLQAGLLPNPSLSGSYAVLLGGPASFDAWSAGLTEDIKAIITMSPLRKSAQYSVLQVDADLVWSEWGLISKVALLVVDIVEGTRRAQLIDEERGILQRLYTNAQTALQQGNLDISGVAPIESALAGVEKDGADLARQQQSRRHDLNALLGLAPDVTVPLAATLDLQPLGAAEVHKMLGDLSHRRPDLVALQLGYRSQEAKVRAAVLAQFPALVFGGTYNVDTSHVRSAGPSITLDLPFFNRNQGGIAIEQATRQKLHDEYTSRLAAATTEIEASTSEDSLIERQLRQLEAELPAARRIEENGAAAYRAGNIDARSYVDLVTTRISKEEDINALQQLLFEDRIKIASLLGIGIPSVNFPAYRESTP